MKHVDIVRRNTGEILFRRSRWCRSRWCRFWGLQFRRKLKLGESLILVHPDEGVLQSSIHMFFVNFPIAAIWIDSMGRVTSAQLAKPWRPYYASPSPAQYVLEASPDFLSQVEVGDEFNFVLSA